MSPVLLLLATFAANVPVIQAAFDFVDELFMRLCSRGRNASKTDGLLDPRLALRAPTLHRRSQIE